MRSQAGVSIMEVVMAVGISAIVLGLGIPAMQNFTTNNQLRRITEEMHAGLMQAKSEAIRGNATVNFITAGTGYSLIRVGIGGDPDTVLFTRAQETSEINFVVNAPNMISFTSTGRVAQAANMQINISNPTHSACSAAGGDTRCLRLTVTPAGSVKICDPALPAADARAC